jgi:hypothetical protein
MVKVKVNTYVSLKKITDMGANSEPLGPVEFVIELLKALVKSFVVP